MPKNLNYNSTYKITGDILQVSYGKEKKELINKIILTDGKKDVNKVIGINKAYNLGNKIYIDNSDFGQGYYELESSEKVQENYKNLILKIQDFEISIDSFGNSKIHIFYFGKLKVERGKVYITIDDLEKLTQGEEIKYTILNSEKQEVEDVKVKLYLEN